jgi:zinc transport system substrate-binding protein
MRSKGLARAAATAIAATAIAAVVAGAMIVAGAHAQPKANPAGKVKVTASVFPLAAIVSEVGGGKVSVTTVVPPGSDPHNFEMTPMTAKAIEQADLIFLVGGHFDRWILGSGFSGAASRAHEFLGVFGDSLIKTGEETNPHIWLDPLLAKRMGVVAGEELSRVDPANRAYYESRAAVFSAAMDSLHASLKARLRKSGFRAYVAFHPAWTYFARRYGLEERAILELTPEQEPSARWIARVLKTMKDAGIKFVIAEEFSNKALAQMVAGDSGARVVVLDPLGGGDRPGRDSYAALMNYNLAVIEEAARRDR